ncbi:hypothetical protein [Plantactinospora sp. CA-290183]|uniref:hypothetical protein n=1 Tax=Plantactinospora sp. CA-290183 TaxID=3240006 RepID=UPI003D8F3675
MNPIDTPKALDDVLKAPTLDYASLPGQLFLNAELCHLLEELESVAHRANTAGGTDDDETEAGTLLGFTSASGGLSGLDVSVHQGSAFDPKTFTGGEIFDPSTLSLGFRYQGTVHSHPRRATTDPMRSFSAIDMITVMLRSYRERVSIMVSGTEVHLLLCADQVTVRLPGRESSRIVVRSLEDLTSGTPGTLELDPAEIAPLSMGPQTVGAITESASRLRFGYYTGTIGGPLTRRS